MSLLSPLEPGTVLRPGLLPGGEVQGLQARHGVAHTVKVDAVPVVAEKVVAGVWQVLVWPMSPQWDGTTRQIFLIRTARNLAGCAASPDTIDMMRFIPVPGLVVVVGVRQFWGEGNVRHVVRRAAHTLALAGGVRGRGGAGAGGHLRLLGEAGGVGGRVQGPRASQLGGKLSKLSEVEWPRHLGREGGGGRVVGQVGGAHRLVETFPGAGRGVRLLLHPQQLLDPLAQQGGTSLSLLACKSRTWEVRLWLWLWPAPTFTLFAVEEVVVDVGHQAGHDLRLVSHPVLLRAPLAPPQHACKVKQFIRRTVQSVHSPQSTRVKFFAARRSNEALWWRRGRALSQVKWVEKVQWVGSHSEYKTEESHQHFLKLATFPS